MQDYSKLVEDLRDGVGYWYMNNSSRLVSILGDAADAIEALQAEIRESMQRCAECGDELAHQMPKRGEIVRCGECKWYGIYYAKKDGTPDKRYRPSVCLRGKYAKRRDPDWFCADGEREVQE